MGEFELMDVRLMLEVTFDLFDRNGYPWLNSSAYAAILVGSGENLCTIQVRLLA